MWDGFKEEDNEVSWSRMDPLEIVEVEGMLDAVIKGPTGMPLHCLYMLRHQPNSQKRTY